MAVHAAPLKLLGWSSVSIRASGAPGAVSTGSLYSPPGHTAGQAQGVRPEPGWRRESPVGLTLWLSTRR